MSKLTMLMILDGFGINEKEEGNSVKYTTFERYIN